MTAPVRLATLALSALGTCATTFACDPEPPKSASDFSVRVAFAQKGVDVDRWMKCYCTD